MNEVVGVVQRIQDRDGVSVMSVLKRDGALVEVVEDQIIRLKVIPPGRGRVRIPKNWPGETG
ncbi:MAG: hypothetical protein ACRDI1_00800 [Actinomycetota bacterium]